MRHWRIYCLLAGFLGVLFVPFALRLWLIRAPEATGAASPSGGALELRIITPHNQDIRHVFEAAFSDWHRERFGASVAITYLSPGGSNDIVRYLKDVYGSYLDASGALPPEEQMAVGIELIWGGGDYAFERDFKPLLEPLKLDPALLAAAFPERDLAGVPLLDPEGSPPKWVGVVLSSFGIVYSPDVYASLGLPAPEVWEDLARPELAGLVALADPTRSGSAALAYMMVLERAMADAEERWLEMNPAERSRPSAELDSNPGYRRAIAEGWKRGMGTLLSMSANARYFTDQGSRPCVDVGDGEAAGGLAIDFFARVFEEEIGSRRVSFVAPRAATAITPDPIGVLYGTRGEREVLANRFVEFLLTPEAQRLWNLKSGASPYVARSLRRMPVRRDVYADRSGWADDENPFELAGGFNMRRSWTRQLGQLIPIWAAAWMDSKPDLDRAYRAVLAVADPERRRLLATALADLPIELEEVLRLTASSGRDVGRSRLEATRRRMAHSERFRRHYVAIERRARGEG